MSSIDGKIWSMKNDQPLRFPRITSQGSFILAADDFGYILASTNSGQTWFTTRTNAVGGLNNVSVGNGLFLVSLPYISGDSEMGRVFYSTNGQDWASFEFGKNFRINGVIFVNGQFVAAAVLFDESSNISIPRFLSSPNGHDWTYYDPPHEMGYVGLLSYGAGRFVVNGNADSSYRTNYFWTSTNLVNWERSDLDLGSAGNISGICFGNGTYVVDTSAGIFQSNYVEPTPPSIIKSPIGLAIYQGNPVQMLVLATGSDPLQFQWRKGGQNIEGATNSIFSISTTEVSDEGTYDVVISNSAGKVTSHAALLQISRLSVGLFAGLKIRGTVGSSHRIEFREGLSSGNWQFLTNLTLATDPFIWIDYSTPENKARFYRDVDQPE